MHRSWRGWVALPVVVASAGAIGIKGTVTGTIVDWPKGTSGTVQLLLDPSDDISMSRADAPLDTAGKFSLTLPDLEARGQSAFLPKVSELFTEKSSYNECPGTGTATPNTGTFKSFFLMTTQDGKPLGDIEYRSNADYAQNVGTVVAELMYFSQATTLNGTLTCVQGDDVAFRGTFPAGWNLVRTEQVASSKPGKRLRQVTAAGSLQALTWRLFTEFGGTGLTFKLGDQGETAVNTVAPGQPADLAGLKAGDVIRSVNGRSGLPFAETITAIRGKPGIGVTLVVRRAGESRDLTFHVVRALIRVP